MRFSEVLDSVQKGPDARSIQNLLEYSSAVRKILGTASIQRNVRAERKHFQVVVNFQKANVDREKKQKL